VTCTVGHVGSASPESSALERVVERIAGRRLAHAWLRELRGARDADDIELRGRERLTRG